MGELPLTAVARRRYNTLQGQLKAMRALVTGATGFVGRRLMERLGGGVVLSRDPKAARERLGPSADAFGWNPEEAAAPARAFDGVETVFNLAGEPVAEGRWTAGKKQRIRDSRVLGTRNLVKTLESLRQRPSVLVAASAVGFYGDRGDELLEETSDPGEDFLAEVCRAWEAEALKALTFGMRVVMARIGIVLDRSGGALAKMLPPFRLGLGGRMGSGQQWMPWIQLDDLVAMLVHAAENAGVVGAMNAVAPAPARNREFTEVLARLLKRPAVFPVPKLALRLALGEVSDVLLGSQRAMPRVALQTAFRFRYPELVGALTAALENRRRIKP